MRTKIVCTIGPATESEEMIEKLIAAGMRVARMNFSHDTHEAHGRRIDRVRKVAQRLGEDVKILCDLQGPKIRVSDFKNGPRRLNDNDKVVLVTNVCNVIHVGEICIEDPYLHTDVNVGDIVLIDDGLIELIVEEVEGHKIKCMVVNGGDLHPRKGVNLPLTTTTTSSLTEKDEDDLKYILTKNPDWIAISFVQTVEDITRLIELMGESKSKVMCKIERANAIDNLSEIIKKADGIMVARGDLGVEIPFEKLPILQKRIIKSCNYNETPVVTATQMLASMTHSPVPTRAEVTDIANAIMDGTDAVMLSNETTVGKYPIESVKTMARIIKETENFIFNRENKI